MFFVGAGEEVFGLSVGTDFYFEVNAVAVPFDLHAAVPCGNYAWRRGAAVKDFGEYGQRSDEGCFGWELGVSMSESWSRAARASRVGMNHLASRSSGALTRL